MFRRLYWQVHLAFVVVVVGSLACAGFFARTVSQRERVPLPVAPIAELVAAEVDRSSVAEAAERLHLRLTVWDGALHPLAWSDLHDPPDPRGPPVQWLGFHEGPTAAVHLADGRWLGLGYDWQFDHRRFVVGLGAMAICASLLLYPLARRLTRRIERLQATVERWGEGDLAARAHVHGHDEVATLGRGFNRAADRVQALVDGQRRMLASASHELRSPLARLRMAVELLDDGTPERTAMTTEASRDVEELDDLVGDLLLASRLQARPEPGPRELVDVAALLDDEARRAGVPTVVTVPAAVDGDPKMLRRALRNLLDNAGRHAGGADRAEVSTAGGVVTVSVSDRGAGIDVTEAARVFEPFYRPAGHREGHDGGVGLGLALVRDIARHHGGDVIHVARPGGGSTFLLTIQEGSEVKC